LTGAARSDEELMAEVRGGALDRLAELFRRHAPLLREFFRRRVRDAPASDDLVQETFLRVLQYRRSWRGEGTFAGWLFRLAANLMRDRSARTRREGEPSEPAAPAARDGARPDASLARAEAAARLHAALAQLEPDARALVAMRWFEEIDADAIGQRLGCTAGAARVRLHRVHARLLDAYCRSRAPEASERAADSARSRP
jgi:RNA polymerase sigma-70 factor (ECF subfamily)